jgi:hypothetical protein
MSRRALRAADPSPGASLRGIVFDACYINSIPHTFGMLRHFGMPNRNRVLVSESANLNTAGLAAALRIDELEVLARRYPPYGRGHRTFYGLHILKARIEDRVRRFSPAAIAKGILHHPATHELRDLPFSTVGWDMLQDTCPCTDDGVVQNWVTVNGSSRCQSCGRSLGKIAAVPVPDDLRASLAFIAGLVDPDPAQQDKALEMLPPPVRGVSRTLLYDMVMNIARVVGADPDVSDFPIRTQALARACHTLMEWPRGLAHLDRAGECPAGVWDWVRRQYTILDTCSQTPNAPRPTAASSGPAMSPSATYVPSGSAGSVHSSFIGASAAARLCGVDESALKQAWDEGRFTQHVWVQGALRTRAFDPAEVIAVAPNLRVSGSRSLAASHLGLPVYGLEQLLEHGLFAPEPPGPALKQTVAHMEAARRFISKLEQARSDIEDAITFSTAIRHVSGRMKPWGAAFAAMLDGDIPFSILEGSASSFVGRILVRPDAVATLLALYEPASPKVTIERADRWMQSDALECLNGNVSAAELLNGLISTGTPRRKSYAVADVLRRASTGVTTSDLARRSCMEMRSIARVLTAEGVGQIAPGLWDRARAERIIRRHAGTGCLMLWDEERAL